MSGSDTQCIDVGTWQTPNGFQKTRQDLIATPKLPVQMRCGFCFTSKAKQNLRTFCVDSKTIGPKGIDFTSNRVNQRLGHVLKEKSVKTTHKSLRQKVKQELSPVPQKKVVGTFDILTSRIHCLTKMLILFKTSSLSKHEHKVGGHFATAFTKTFRK